MTACLFDILLVYTKKLAQLIAQADMKQCKYVETNVATGSAFLVKQMQTETETET